MEAWRAADDEQDRLRHHFLDYVTHHRDAMQRSCRPEHITVSALIMNGEHVLLTMHDRVRRWLQTGGHCEPSDSSMVSAARREATEESGIAELSLMPNPVRLARHFAPFCKQNAAVHHLDVQYLAIAPDNARTRESDELGWWPAGALPANTDDAVRELVTACTAS